MTRSRDGAGLAVVLAAAFALAGCATVPTPVSRAPVAADAFTAFDDWVASGRVAVRTAADGWSASFEWQEAGGRGEVGVRGPFGAGAARIVRTAETIRIDAGDGPPVEIPAPFAALEPVLVERLGVPLPLAQLRWWLVGVPAPGEASDGAAGAFRQSGWDVRVDEYASVIGAPGPLPRRLVLEREGARIRVVVDRWTPGGAAADPAHVAP